LDNVTPTDIWLKPRTCTAIPVHDLDLLSDPEDAGEGPPGHRGVIVWEHLLRPVP